MDPERWKQLDSLLQSVLQRPPEERDAYLRGACAGDQAMEGELRSLLKTAQEAGSFLENPAMDVAARAMGRRLSDARSSEFPSGETVSHYRIVEKLGTGGMGVVYKAEDIRLHRLVALKFPLDEIAQDPRALSRFQREARAASALNHANICTIYEVEEHNGQPVIVMELLEGESLKQRMRRGPIPPDELVEFGIQMAGALEAAHAKGIIHRDIKPANIFITGPHSQAKILDFGLAKPTVSDHRAAAGETATMEAELTSEGNAPGTVPYMSPEQVSAKELDTRTDLFSLGVVLYEMATGKLPFRGESTGLIFEAILNRVPVPPAQLNPDVPAELERIVGKCLEKDRQLRYQHAAEIGADLQRLKRDSESGRLTSSAPPGPVRGAAKHWKIVLPVAAAVAASLAAGYFYLHRAPKLTDKDTIVLADFVNKTGDPVFDDTVRQDLAAQLEQSPFLSLVSDERIRQTLRLMGRPEDAQLTPEIGKEVCERTASAAVLDGSIALLGSQYVLTLQARNCRTGDILDAEQAPAAKKEDVLNAVSQIASRFRTRAGESLSTVEKYDTPLAEATTSSLEALKAYSLGVKVGYSTGLGDGIPHFQRAVELDPKFAKAYAHMGIFYDSVGEFALARESIAKAYELRERTSDRERFFITANYYVQVKGDLEKGHEILELWAQTYPRDKQPHGFLSALASQELGKYEQSIEEAGKALAIDPDFAPGYVNQVWSNLYLDRLDEAGKALQRAAERKLEPEDIFLLRYYLAFLKGDQAGMQRAIDLAKGKPVEAWVLDEEAFGLASSGRLQQAGSIAQRAVEMAQHAGHREEAAMFQAGTAVRQAFFGDAAEARQAAMAALELSKDRDVEYGSGFALALSGDSSRSQTLADDLEKRFPEDTLVRFTYVPTIRAAVALKNGDPAKAREFLQAAIPYDFALPGTWFGFFGMMYPVYVRGEAYLAARQYAEAAAEFQKILDRRGLLFSDPVGPAARLQLARALALSGDTAKAKAAYQDFLTRWKDADRDIPVLQQAQAESARLR